MKMPLPALLLAAVPALLTSLTAASFTPLVPAPRPTATTVPASVPGGNFAVTNLVDGSLKTEFASPDQGTNTVVELDFGKPIRLSAIRHVDRNDRATVAESRLDVFDQSGGKVDSIGILHTNRRSGVTQVILPKPLTVTRARWQVTRLGDKGLFSVGGAELSFFTAEPNDAAPVRDQLSGRVLPFLKREGTQTVKVTLDHAYVELATVALRLGTQKRDGIAVHSGANELEWEVPAVKSRTILPLLVEYEGQVVARGSITQAPPREMTIYILPHSHTDIGYTEIQTAIENKQVKNVVDGLAAAKRTADYPEGARFVWNVEVGWAADLFLHRMDAQQRSEFFAAVKQGDLVLNGMYLNELTGLCRPEELIQLFRFATKISAQTGVPIESAMISDVPGYSWGTVTAMSQAGIKYLSTAPNYFDRIGNILQQWENKPFYWEASDGKNRVLVWIPFWGYAMSHIYHEMSPRLLDDFYAGLEKKQYPYDIAYVRWAGHGDNAVPDPAICDFVRHWNTNYAWPRLVISGTTAAFQALEKRYGKRLPVVRGDWTPYWEDGAGSSALQTAQNRQSSDRLDQAAALYAMRRPADYSLADFETAWRNVLLYSEHTWGAWCSISGPERKETQEQWAIKKFYVDEADTLSRTLLAKALGQSAPGGNHSAAIEVVNTLSWPRSELVTLSGEQSAAGDRILDSRGKAVASQRLASGELVFQAENVPAYGSRSYTVASERAQAPQRAAEAKGNTLENSVLHVRVDDQTGSIVELTARGIPGNLAQGDGLNRYQYLLGDDPRNVQGNGQVKITIGDPGPLVASLVIESSAPGCKSLRTELRLAAGDDSLLVFNTVDKERLAARSYFAPEGKESLNFGFSFNVPEGDLLYDVPFGTVRTELDQMPSACKNWLTVNRWAAVANKKYGVTWVTLDAPLIQAGYLSATLLNSQTNPDIWRKRIDRTQRFYSWAMNNHWGTNYRAYQDGPTTFRFVLRPYSGKPDPGAATRFAVSVSQPLLVTAASPHHTDQPLLTLDSPDVIVTGLKPADDGKALIVRLFGATSAKHTVRLAWGSHQPKSVRLSDTSERAGHETGNKVAVPGYGVVTLRVEL